MSQRRRSTTAWSAFPSGGVDAVGWSQVELGFIRMLREYSINLKEKNPYTRAACMFRYWMEKCIIPHFSSFGVIPPYGWTTLPSKPIEVGDVPAFGAFGEDHVAMLTVGPSHKLPGLQGCFVTDDARSGCTVAFYSGYILDERLVARCTIGLYTSVQAAHLTFQDPASTATTTYCIVASPCLAGAQINHGSHATVKFTLNPNLRTHPTVDRTGRVLTSGKVYHLSLIHI